MNLQARNCEVNEAMTQHFEDKIQHIERMWPGSDDAQVRVRHERGRFSAEITLHSGGLVTRGEERADNLRQAFDSAIDKIETQLRRHKKARQQQIAPPRQSRRCRRNAFARQNAAD